MKVSLFAYYTVAADNLEDMDAAADKALAGIDAKEIGRGTFLQTRERDIGWEIPADQAYRAKAALESSGFRVAIDWRAVS